MIEKRVGVEQVTPSVTFEWILDGRACLMALADMKRETVDAWADKIAAVAREWPADRPFAAMYDVSASWIGLTPYVRERSAGLAKLRPELPWAYNAIILPRNVMTQFMALFVRTSERKKIDAKAFFSREEGLTWLKKVLEIS